MHSWYWDWGWGWAAAVGTILALAVFVLPWFFFLLNLNTLLDRVKRENRAIAPSHVWLNFIPIFNLGWFLYTVGKIRDSVKSEYASRGWPAEDDFGYNVGLVTGILWLASFFLWWVPLIGWAAGIGWLVCWIIYWVKTSDLKNRLTEGEAWNHGSAHRRYSTPGGPFAGPHSTPGAYPPPTPGGHPGAPTGAGPYVPPGPYAQPRPYTQPDPYAQPGPSATGEPVSSNAETEDDRSRRCAACGAGYDSGDKFCRVCGLPLP